MLKSILENHIVDVKLAKLLHTIIDSFTPGLPLGNLTSQLFINIYLHELDIYIKHKLGIKYYIRYADDVVIVSTSLVQLNTFMDRIMDFLSEILKLQAHKVEIKSMYSGVDVVGEIFFPKYKIMRRSTAKNILKRQSQNKYDFA